MKRFRKKNVFLLFLITGVLEGKNFEIKGNLFPISEESLASFLSRSIQEMSPAELARRQEKSKLYLGEKSSNPSPVPHIREAAEYRSFLFDPSYTAKEEIKDAAGRIIVRRGDRVTPLLGFSLSSGLLFFNGENERHIEWAKRQRGNFKWILIKGPPVALEQKELRPVYFDQGGRYTKHFQIQHVPARVKQEGEFLLIEEIPVEEGLQEPSLPDSKMKNVPSVQDELSEFVALAMQNVEKGQDLSPTLVKEEKKCSTRAWIPDESTFSDNPRLFIFISFSVPVESWRDLSCELDKAGGVFIVNGIPNNSFQEFAVKVKELRQKGIDTPIQIDPLSFEKYGIEHVPAIVLDAGHAFDKIYGNVRLSIALDLMAESGAVSSLGEDMLNRLK
jgi:conjugal transfer pilus assembly protein TraW